MTEGTTIADFFAQQLATAYTKGFNDAVAQIAKAAGIVAIEPERIPTPGSIAAPAAQAPAQASAEVIEIPKRAPMPSEDSVRTAGRIAAQTGTGRIDNPHFRGSKPHDWWDQGWLEGEPQNP